jgi:hypothetical protein
MITCIGVLALGGDEVLHHGSSLQELAAYMVFIKYVPDPLHHIIVQPLAFHS